MEAAIRKALGIPVTLVKGDRGIFEVRLDGDLIYSKKECADQFPTHAAIIAMLRPRESF